MRLNETFAKVNQLASVACNVLEVYVFAGQARLCVYKGASSIPLQHGKLQSDMLSSNYSWLTRTRIGYLEGKHTGERKQEHGKQKM